MLPEPQADNGYHAKHVARLMASFAHWTGRPLLSGGDEDAAALYAAEFVVVSHGTEDDPIFNYGNRAAQALFEMSWAELTRLPSRCSAEPVARAERAELMHRVSTHGFIDDYRGVRISARGRRFMIEQAVVWNVLDEGGRYMGQAATFDTWTPLP